MKNLKVPVNSIFPLERNKTRRKMPLMAFLLCLFSIMSIMCGKEDDIAQDYVYGPVQEMQFGDESAIVQELSFNYKQFSVVGDFRTPVEGEVHPLILMIHGSGSATRNGSVPFEPLIEIFLKNGYAVLSWDKPGSGASRGEFNNDLEITERAEILVEAVQILLDNSSVDPSSIGLWGISQAGWVMPKALSMTSKIAFMVVVSGGGEEGIEQFAYQVGQVAACSGEAQETINNVEKFWSQMARATTYPDYQEAAQFLSSIASVVDYTGISVIEEDQWKPWPRDIDAFFDPMDIIRKTSIPVLAFFGELDKNVDPIQGAQAYNDALNEAGNQDHRIEVIQGAGHILTHAQTGCLDEVVSTDYVPGYLEILESWLESKSN